VYILDTDHVTEYQKGTSAEAIRLKDRLQNASAAYGTTIITVEEIMRGWMAAIHRLQDTRQQIGPYARLQDLIRFFATWKVLRWDELAVDQFESLRQQKIRVGTMDLKIASIALANGATLLTRKRKDFDRVPNLRCEDWLS